MSDYMAEQMNAQIDGAICENERLAVEVDCLTAEAADLRRERDELRTQVHIITSERDELADCVQSLRAKHAELAARLEAIEAQEPVAWVEHELQGTGLRHLHFEYRPNTLRDEVVDPVWTELIARPAPRQRVSRADELTPAAPSEQLASRPACDWPGKCKHQRQRPSPSASPERPLYPFNVPLDELDHFRWKRIAENAQAVTTGGDDPDEATSPGV